MTIPTPSLREIRSRVASPVIVRTKPNRLRSVFDDIQAFDLERFADRDNRIMQGKVLEKFRESTQPFYEKAKLELFDMFSIFLPREAIFSLADRKNVDRIFYDKPMYAFYSQTPTQNQFKAPRTGTTSVPTSATRKLMGSDKASKKGYRGQNTTIGIVDTGGSRTHEQNRRMVFDSAMHGQYSDKNGHGEHCASIAGGIRRKDEQTSRRIGKEIICEGMATKADLIGIKSLGFVIGSGTSSSVAKGINMSVDKYNVDVISMSLGGTSTEKTPEDDMYYEIFEKIRKMDNAPIPVLASGNSGPDRNTVGSPGCLPNVLTVGAYDPRNGGMAGFSSRGPPNWEGKKPDVVAPGVNIHSGIIGYLDGAGDKTKNRYSPLSGTSMATPHVSGLVAQMRQAYRSMTGSILTIDDIKDMMREEGHDKDNISGWGDITWNKFERWME